MRVPHGYRLAIGLFVTAFASPVSAQPGLPSNLHVEPIYLDLVESMANQSSTFDAQLRRIAAAPGVTVYVDIIPRVIGARARTRMVRQGDGLTAWMEVARFDDVVELIAHEIEHVIEQVERVDLATGAGVPRAGIHSVSLDGATFETARAALAGVTVAREVRSSRNATSGRNGT